ncbi:minor capsid protein [human papillomavirus 137]|uniref:Minor capsid protein L2 n=1 Tax=human papillomavirus 137 TaxID=1070410 RepID=I3P6M2_9PAPI|nr:minor capsid protein [human papillomavirus 137]AEM24612.1 minor capsid protein [human papillomavirus 137]
MQANKRRKRAAVEDIYAKGCTQPGGYCPPDVKNKVEGNTWADFLLKVFGSVVYFGGLGIGTGKGTGGSTGYTPLGGTVGSRGTTNTIKPTIPLDPLGVPDIVTVDPIAPEAASIVPLAEGLPEPGVIDTGTSFPGLAADNENIVTVLDPLSEVTGVGEHPNIITGGTADSPAILDVQTSPPPAKKILLDPSISKTTTAVQTHASHVDANLNIFVDAQSFGTHVGYTEDIPLEEINLRSEFELEDSEPKTSTPFAERVLNKTKQLYSKYVQQVPTRPAEFALYTSRFEFENPAFEEDVTMEFENDLAEIGEITTPAVSDVRILNRPIYSETADRTVRISRLGQRAGMKTRSGLEIGQRVHFYFDLSDIPRESIELNTYGNYSHESTIVDELLSSTFINPFEMPVDSEIFAENELLDPLEEDFRDSHIVVPYLEDEQINITPTLPPGLGLKVYSDLSERDLLIHYPVQHADIMVPDTPYIPVQPPDGVLVDDNDYYLHPGLYSRKRKRRVL